MAGYGTQSKYQAENSDTVQEPLFRPYLDYKQKQNIETKTKTNSNLKKIIILTSNIHDVEKLENIVTWGENEKLSLCQICM